MEDSKTKAQAKPEVVWHIERAMMFLRMGSPLDTEDELLDLMDRIYGFCIQERKLDWDW